MEVASHLKMSLNENIEEFLIDDVEQKPNRYICFLKVKIFTKEKERLVKKVKGSGVILDDKWVLTAAHNVFPHGEGIEQIKLNKFTPQDNSYVKLAMHKG